MKMDKIPISINGKDHIIGVEKHLFQARRRIFLDNKLYLRYRKLSHVYTYYHLNIDGKPVVLAIYKDGWDYKYGVFIDGISVNNGSEIDKERKAIEETVSEGFWNYCRMNKINAFIKALFCVCIIVGAVVIGDFEEYGRIIVNDRKMLVLFVILPVSFLLFMSMYLFEEWNEKKEELKNWDKQFQPVRIRKEKYYL